MMIVVGCRPAAGHIKTILRKVDTEDDAEDITAQV